jgi:hypothetical protein
LLKKKMVHCEMLQHVTSSSSIRMHSKSPTSLGQNPRTNVFCWRHYLTMKSHGNQMHPCPQRTFACLSQN